jgi:hypothetical protein
VFLLEPPSDMEILMSKGPGPVMRKIDSLFASDPQAVFSTADLCAYVYGLELYELAFQFPKKQRVAIIRAAHRVARNHPGIHALKTNARGNSWLWFHHDNPKSSQLARSRANSGSSSPEANPPRPSRKPSRLTPQPQKDSQASLAVFLPLFAPH